MNKRIRTNRLHRYILASGLIMVSFGIWISCSKDVGVSSISPTDDGVSSRRSVGTKPAVGSSNYADFHPQTNVNYDPFKDMSFDDRKAAIGGPPESEKYLQVVVRHLAHAMNDDKARVILHQNVPKPGEGEIRISQLFIDYPDLLTALSGNFKSSISDKAIGGRLSQIIQDVTTDSEAILKASKALFDLEIRLVTPAGMAWDSSQKIPVFYTPLNDQEATVMVGVGPNLERITFPMPNDKKTAPYAFLLLNFDEDLIAEYYESELSSVLHQHESLWSWHNLFGSIGFASPAYAHHPEWGWLGQNMPPHNDCYHTKILQPVKRIQITTTSEIFGDDPEIYMLIDWSDYDDIDPDKPRRYRKDLTVVNNTYTYYYDYAYLRTPHGTCGSTPLHVVVVGEYDIYDLNGHDILGRWPGATIPFGGIVPNQVDLSTLDTTLRMRRTDDDAF